ncbi:alanine:cation symporter family protein, partial [bacterium]|nr:alanine:cation symporter family protein [bacterium]
MPIPRLALLLLVITAFPVGFLSAQTDVSTASEQEVVNQTATDNVSEDSSSETSQLVPEEQALPESQSTEAVETAEDVEASVAARIDEAFGQYVVGPFATVLFFDFGTSSWLGTSIPFVVVWLLAGAVFLTLRMGFINLRAFKHAIDLTRGIYDKPGETGEVSHFQALSAALSATVGLGNIAGVAIAIGTGGPGACLWIIAIGILGMSAKFAECTLGQL